MSKQIKIDFRLPDKNAVPSKPKKPVPKPLTLKQALLYIENGNFEPDLKKELIKRISRYPTNTLNMAMNNLQKIIIEATQKIRGTQDAGVIPSAFAEFLKANKKEENNEEPRIHDHFTDPESTGIPGPDVEISGTKTPTARSSSRPSRKKFKEEGKDSSEGSVETTL